MEESTPALDLVDFRVSSRDNEEDSVGQSRTALNLGRKEPAVRLVHP